MKKLMVVLMTLLIIGCINLKESDEKYVCSDGMVVKDPSECSVEEAEEEVEEAKEEIVEEVVEKPEVIEVAKPELSAAEEKKLDSRFKKGTKAVLSSPLTPKLAPGDSYVVALGITNLAVKDYNFTITPRFRRAKTFSGSSIDAADHGMMKSWLEFEPQRLELERNEQATIPITIYVGDMLNEEEEIGPGNYIFEFDIDYEQKTFSVDYERLEFSVHVDGSSDN